MKKLLYIFIILTIYFNCFAATYYVSTTASGDNDGSSWANAFTDQTSLNSIDMASGSIVNFKAGDTFPGSNGSVTLAGITGSGKTITLQGLTTGDATPASGQEPLFDADTSTTNQFEITNTNITTLNIYNIQFEGQDTGAFNAYIRAFDIDNVHIDNVDIDGYGGETYNNDTNTQAIWIHSGSGAVEIENCTIQNLGPSVMPANGYSDTYGLFVEQASGTVHIHDNVIHDINADALQMVSVDAVTTIEYNEWYNCGEQPLDIKHSNNIIVRYNNFYREPSYTGFGGVPSHSGQSLILVQIVNENDIGNDWNSDNIQIYGNYLHDNNTDGPRGAISFGGTVVALESCTASNTPHKCCDGDTDPVDGVDDGTCDDAFNMTNVSFHHNWIENADGGIRVVGLLDGYTNHYYYNNVILNSNKPSIYENHLSSINFYGNTIVNTSAPDDIDADEGVIYLPYSSSTYINNVIVSAGSDYLFYRSSSGSPTINHNLWHNTTEGEQSIIYYGGTIYDEDELTTGDNWQGSHAGSMFELAEFNNLSSHYFWPITSESNLLGAGADLGDDYDDLIDPSSVFTTNTPTVSTVLQPAAWTLGAYGYEGIEAPPVDYGKTKMF